MWGRVELLFLYPDARVKRKRRRRRRLKAQNGTGEWTMMML
jgi:hypothetical protein